ncbi:MAG TPA: transposase [Phycisphaerae bacterium]|nr:transposase [Phycisphaerae bacterium]HRY71199.1 transposase [Phycisphaerae bacterium]HSA29489.1 transposase [Phycisphaerae bacterium]
MTVVTTLTDPGQVPADSIRDLYRDRWTAELNLRNLKTFLTMEVLRGESPDVVRKEIAMHLLVYNLIRLLMWNAARQHGRDLHRLSFAGTLHRLRATVPLLAMIDSQSTRRQLVAYLIESIANDTVPYRPNRVEPRRVKRRPKAYDLLNRPRHSFRGRIDDSCR